MQHSNIHVARGQVTDSTQYTGLPVLCNYAPCRSHRMRVRLYVSAAVAVGEREGFVDLSKQ